MPTWSSNVVADVWLNEKPVGEVGLNAAVCGEFNVPVLMVSGDQAAAEEARDCIPGVKTAVVKQAEGRYAAACLSPATTRQILRDTAVSALEQLSQNQSPQPLKTALPVTIRLALRNTAMADRVQFFPGLSRLDGRTVVFEAETMVAAYHLFRAVTALAG